VGTEVVVTAVAGSVADAVTAVNVGAGVVGRGVAVVNVGAGAVGRGAAGCCALTGVAVDGIERLRSLAALQPTSSTTSTTKAGFMILRIAPRP
jgi:hypothetical protein